MSKSFAKFASRTSDVAGSSWAFLIAILVIAVWALSGPIFSFSNTWQLIINTLTTLVTFLMVFLIQNTQNRDSKALHLKLDEVIRAIDSADDRLINVEELSEKDLKAILKTYAGIFEQERGSQPGNPDVARQIAAAADGGSNGK